MESKVATQVDYKKSSLVHPEYKYSKIYQQTGSQDVTVTTAGNAESVFELPAQVINFAKSVLSCVITPDAGAAYTYAHMDCVAPIRQIQLYTRNGVYMVDVNRANEYTKVVWKPETKLSEFLDMPNHDAGDGWGNYLQKCNVDNKVGFGAASTDRTLALITAGATSAVTAATEVAIDTAINVAKAQIQSKLNTYIAQPATASRRYNDSLVVAGTGTSSPVNVPYTEAKYFAVGGTGTATPVINVKLPLGILYDTILALDKDFYFGEVLYLRVVWEASTKVFFAGVDAKAPAATPTAFLGSYAISALQLFLCLEQNQEIKNSLMEQVLSNGMDVLVPYVHTAMNVITGSTPFVSNKYNRGHGQRLLKVYQAIFANSESANTAFANSTTGNTLTSYYTTRNNQREQEYDITIANDEDWMIHKDMLKDSAILNANVYHYNWFHLHDYCGGTKANDMIKSGLPLDIEQKIDFNPTVVTGPFRYVTFAISQRVLSISRNGIQIS